MTAYAIAHLRKVDLGPEIFEYLARIDATLDPYGGRFLIHGGPVDPMDGNWSGDLVVIEFADRESANAWYAPPEYQAILRLRTDNSDGNAFIIDGLPDRCAVARSHPGVVPGRLAIPRLRSTPALHQRI